MNILLPSSTVYQGIRAVENVAPKAYVMSLLQNALPSIVPPKIVVLQSY